MSDAAKQRVFDPELQAASIACDCRKRKDYHCSLCQRAWNQAWDLAEGKISMEAMTKGVEDGMGDDVELELSQVVRLELFMSHECQGTYGDDGEMQCNIIPRIDFKRDFPGEILAKASIHRLIRAVPRATPAMKDEVYAMLPTAEMQNAIDAMIDEAAPHWNVSVEARRQLWPLLVELVGRRRWFEEAAHMIGAILDRIDMAPNDDPLPYIREYVDGLREDAVKWRKR